jgi:hypothetical protein
MKTQIQISGNKLNTVKTSYSFNKTNMTAYYITCY